MKATRLPHNPIIHAGLDERLCEHGHVNINGPSLIRVPDWLPNPLGRYYLYFAHHQGTYIRLAYADDLAGPWTVYSPGTLQRHQTCFTHHIASPDVHVDHANQQLWMYYHGCGGCAAPGVVQPTMLAISNDGLNWTSDNQPLGQSYFRVFRVGRWTYAVAAGGRLYRSADGRCGFEPRPGPALDRSGRHWAVWVDDATIHFVYSRWGDRPEHLLYAPVPVDDDWQRWRLTERCSLLKPDHAWEGVNEPLAVSVSGPSHTPVHELRDPAIYKEDERTYLLYTTAGEQGIAIAELHD